MSEEKQHFHVEINSIKVEGMMVKFNIFADTLAQVTSDLEAVIAYVTGSAPLPQQQAALPAQAAKSAPAAKPPGSKEAIASRRLLRLWQRIPRMGIRHTQR
jgi:hypothetical protein